jgi:dGTPase
VLEAMHDIRGFMFERVYLRPEAEAEREQAIEIIQSLVKHYRGHPDEIPDSYRDETDPTLAAIDYVAGMTDRFAIREFERLGGVLTTDLARSTP